MDDVYGDILSNIDDITRSMTREILEMEVPKCSTAAIHAVTALVPYDRRTNLLDPVAREAYKKESVYDDNEYFSKPQSTTATLEGFQVGVSFHEERLFSIINADSRLVVIRCNYGEKVYSGYTKPFKEKKSNRGRKKKEKVPSLRKKQGNGTDFNSQITLIVATGLVSADENGHLPYGIKVYKFKAFRTGRVQLPGATPDTIDDVIECLSVVTDRLSGALHPDGDVKVVATNFNPVMKNYKFVVRMEGNQILDLKRLKEIISETSLSSSYDKPEHPAILAIKYNEQEPKLAIKFSTPLLKDPEKKVRMNIFMRGKVNILGALECATTRAICDYFYWLIGVFDHEIIVVEGDSRVLCHNVAVTPLDESLAIARYFCGLGPRNPEDAVFANDLLELVDRAYDELKSGAEMHSNYVL